jgi:hypothetical protein
MPARPLFEHVFNCYNNHFEFRRAERRDWQFVVLPMM